MSVGGVTRRSLLRGVNTARHYVAVWRPQHCGTAAACTACVLACRHGALRQQGRRVVVDGDRCKGCGACVVCSQERRSCASGRRCRRIGCRRGCSRRGRTGGIESVVGVAIVCRQAEQVPRGRAMACASGAVDRDGDGGMAPPADQCRGERQGARLQGPALRDSASSISSISSAPSEALGFSDGEPATGRNPTASTGERVIGSNFSNLKRRCSRCRPSEHSGRRTSWRVEGPGCPLGVVRVDAAGCSLCEVCVGVCPTGAFEAERDERGIVRT